MISRRSALKMVCGSVLSGAMPWAHAFHRSNVWSRSHTGMTADVVIIGGGVGGTAAALAAANAGAKVILTEETDWIGGQFTAQCLPAPDEHAYIEKFGRTASYARYRELVRDYYRRYYPLTENARSNPRLNPGAGWVSGLCHEPQVSLCVLHAMVAPYVSSGRLQILHHTRAVAAEVRGNSVVSIKVHSSEDGRETVLQGLYFLDATETGELLPMTGTEFVVGSEGRDATGELHASAKANPFDIQSITFCFPVDYVPHGDFTIDKPAQYERWRDYVPALTPSWPGRLFDLESSSPYRDEVRRFRLDPAEDRPNGERFIAELSGKVEDLWTYRRLVSKHNFRVGTYPGSVSLVNWPQNDYWMGNIIGVDAETAKTNLEEAKQLSLSLLYWLQTEAPRPNGRSGWPGIRLRKDISGTSDGLAKVPYFRESRRIRAVYTVTEGDIGREQLALETKQPQDRVRARMFEDSVGIGFYRMDAHPTTGGRNYVDIDALPHQIPLGSLVPVRMENLLPAAKNIGTTHVSSTAFREHPIEWNIGESAGALAAFCIAQGVTPRAVHVRTKLREDLQHNLVAQGVELRWPDPIA